MPDLVAALAPRPVWLTNPRSPTGKPLFRAGAEAAYEVAMRAYREAGRRANLRIRPRWEGEPFDGAYAELR